MASELDGSTQVSLAGAVDPTVTERRDRIAALRDRARQLRRQWAELFSPHDTPVPVDRGWHNLTLALRNIESDHSENRITAAAEHLDQAEWILERETDRSQPSSSQRSPDEDVVATGERSEVRTNVDRQ